MKLQFTSSLMNLCGLCTDGGETAIFVYSIQKAICEKNHKKNVKLSIDSIAVLGV